MSFAISAIGRKLVVQSLDQTSPDERVAVGASGVSYNGGREVPGRYKLERSCRRCRRNRRGAALVEFAIVAPIFFLLVFGIIEFGRAIMVQEIITNASREGARLAVLDAPNPTAGQVNTTVTTYLANAGISGATVTINPAEPTSAGYGQPVSVTVSIPFGNVSWLPAPMFLGKATKLTAKSVMRRETVQ
ncbi:MAG: pilus assembly protein [Planctomycetaceae bacterium]|nr:pilus assembly protein [Planctomycetaceae bacterium]